MKFQNKEILKQTLQFLIFCRYYPEAMNNIMYFMVEENKTLDETLSHFHCSSLLKCQMHKSISHQYHKSITSYNVRIRAKKNKGVKLNGIKSHGTVRPFI